MTHGAKFQSKTGNHTQWKTGAWQSGTDNLLIWGVYRSSLKAPELLSNIKITCWQWFKIWMNTSELSKPDQSNQWARHPGATDGASVCRAMKPECCSRAPNAAEWCSLFIQNTLIVNMSTLHFIGSSLATNLLLWNRLDKRFLRYGEDVRTDRHTVIYCFILD